MTDRKELRRRLLAAVPPEAQRLVASGWLDVQIVRSEHPISGMTVASTEWRKDSRGLGKFIIRIHEKTAEEESASVLKTLLAHEVGHVVLGHFNLEPCPNGPMQQDMLIATDIQVNWYLRAQEENIKHLKGVVAPEWLDMLKLNQQAWPADVLHDILHEMREEQGDGQGNGEGDAGEGEGDPCGGIHVDPEDLADAQAGSAVARAVAGKDYGTGSLARPVGTSGASMPQWVKVVADFARSLVESTLAEARSHTRPNQALRQIGIHVPTLKPRWAYVPDTVVILVDTSGSMGQLCKQIGPAVQYLRQHNMTVRLIAGDTKVDFDEEVESVPDLPGGGGTDIVPLFDRAMTYKPKALICFTDGYVPAWPQENKDVPVLWICESEVPYGQVVKPE